MNIILNFDLLSLNWADVLISSIIGGIVGFAIVEAVDRNRLRKKRSDLFRLKGIYIATRKYDSNSINGIIDIKLNKGLMLLVEATLLNGNTYSGKIIMDNEYLRFGRGSYSHSGVNKWGTLQIDATSDNIIFANIIYQKNSTEMTDPELWTKVKGEDVNKSVLDLKSKYLKPGLDLPTG